MAADDWLTWQRQIRDHLYRHGLLPTPTQEGLRVPSDLISECWLATDRDAAQLPTLCHLTDAAGSEAERGAVVLFLWHLTKDEPYIRYSEAEEDDRRVLVKKLFAEAVGRLPVDAIQTTWQVRWELLFATSAENWIRVKELTRRWIEIEPAGSSGALQALARLYLLSVHPLWHQDDGYPDWWLPYEGSAYPHVGDVFTTVYALTLDGRSKQDTGTWSLPTALSATQFDRVLELDHACAKLMTMAAMTGTMLPAIAAWAAGVVGIRLNRLERVREAATQYEALSSTAEVVDGDNGDGRRLAAWCAVVLYRMLGLQDDARRMAVVWTELEDLAADDFADAWKVRAEIERQLGHDDFIDSYERYVRVSPETDQSWEHTELLRLLLESRDKNASERGLRELAFSHPDRAAVDRLLSWDWPTYSQLSEAARHRWWDGLVFVCDPRVLLAFAQPPWRYAAACFGEAVAIELRDRVFRPFVRAHQFDTSTWPDRERKLYNALVSSRATLGMLVDALELSQSRTSEFGAMVGSFLWRNHRPLSTLARQKPELLRLRAITSVRNAAAHDDIPTADATKIYRDAKRFLDLLVTVDSSPSASR